LGDKPIQQKRITKKIPAVELFAVSNGVTAFYAAQVVADTAMPLTFTANTACCIAIVALVHYKRRKLRRAASRFQHYVEPASPG
jgi:hypothetical protein